MKEFCCNWFSKVQYPLFHLPFHPSVCQQFKWLLDLTLSLSWPNGWIFSSPGRSPGRAIVLHPASALVLASAFAKCWSVFVKVFYVMGKVLSGKLSWPCDRSCYRYGYILLDCPRSLLGLMKLIPFSKPQGGLISSTLGLKSSCDGCPPNLPGYIIWTVIEDDSGLVTLTNFQVHRRTEW